MPRTFTATIFLICTIFVLAVLSVVGLVQTNSTQSEVLELKKQVKTLSETNTAILNKLESGVNVSGTTRGNSGGGGADKYADALNDPKNILVANTSVKVPADAVEGGTLRRSLTSDLKGFNWITENSVDVSNIQSHVHNSFASRDFNKPDNWTPELAYKVEVSDDYKEYTLHLRDDVYWQTPLVDFSDPKFEWLKKPRKLTAEDAKFFFDMILNPAVQAGALKSYYEDLDSVEVVDDHTLKIKWKKKVYHSKVYSIGVYPLPKWLFTKNEDGSDIPESELGSQFNSHWASKYAVGTGPYQITTSKAGEKTIMERFDRYWGDRYPIDRIEWIVVKDPETLYLKVKGGEVDLMPKLPNPKYKPDILEGKEKMFKNGDLEYKLIDVFAYYYFGWNADKPIFADKKVRWAMTHSLNREQILKNVLNGLGSIQTGPFYYKHPATDSSIKPIPFDLAKSKQLLAEAGWTDTDGDGILDKVINGEKTKFEIVMLAYDKPETKTVLSVWKEDLRKIGVVLRAQHVDWPTMQKKMDAKEFDAFTGGWGLSWDINPNQIWHSSQADKPKGSNRVGFRNKEADEIIEALLIEFDPAKRLELARRFHKILHDEQPYTFFYSPQYVTVWQPRLENVVVNKLRPQYLSFPWYLDDSQKKAKVQGK